jgi:aryl-alcohol dehydrogenase-like predicted oxidoreductase
MDYRRLGRSGLLVSDICLGTMVFGDQVDEAMSHRLMDQAFDAGINFLDSAEMYAVPPSPENHGRSEELLGSWLAGKPRDRVIVATKISGPNHGPDGFIPWIRGGGNALDWHHFARAADASLRRLGTDYIDLYQTHWPDRTTPMEAQLEAFERLIDAGKVRYAGLSNETPWGLTRLVALAESAGLPRVVSLQNVYHLLKRDYEMGMSEVCEREEVGMMAFSPTAMGVLSGKYSGGAMPEGARIATYPERFRARYGHERALTAADRYAAIARDAGMAPATMAVAWVRNRPGVTAALPGCTKPSQLDEIIAAGEVTLGDDVLAAIDTVHEEIRNPVV